MKRMTWSLIAGVTLLVLSACLAHGSTLAEVEKRGYVQCGVSPGLAGFSNPDANGNWTGLDVDVCRAVAAATLGDASKVKFTPLSAKERFTALQSGEVDILSRKTAWTFTRDTSLGVNFAGVSYYDAQGFLVTKKRGTKSALKLSGSAICIQADITNELILGDYFANNGMEYKAIVLESTSQLIKGLSDRLCTVVAGDISQLHEVKAKLADPGEVVLLPETYCKKPLGPAVRQGDDAWFNIVKWSLNTLINGEELGVSSENIETMKNSARTDIKRLLGLEGIKGQGLGLPDDWAYQILRQVGNYAEVYERNVGAGSALKIERGRNNLWNQGGLLYGPPVR